MCIVLRLSNSCSCYFVRFMLEVNDDMAKEFLKKITSLAENIGCKVRHNIV